MATWETVKSLPRPFATLEIGDVVWRVVDEIVMHEDSEVQHALAIEGAKDKYKTRSTQKYPDGTVVTDTGYAQCEGSYELDLLGLAPGKPVVILHRIDYIVGDYVLEVFANGKRTGEVRCDGADRAHRWRNWPIPIAAEHVTASKLRVRLASRTPNRDVHLYHVWVYQPGPS